MSHINFKKKRDLTSQNRVVQNTFIVHGQKFDVEEPDITYHLYMLLAIGKMFQKRRRERYCEWGAGWWQSRRGVLLVHTSVRNRKKKMFLLDAPRSYSAITPNVIDIDRFKLLITQPYLGWLKTVSRSRKRTNLWDSRTHMLLAEVLIQRRNIYLPS